FIISQNYTEQSLTTSVRLLEETFFIYDAAYEPALKAAMTEYYREFNSSGYEPEEVDLQGLKSKIQEDISSQVDLYIINDEGVVIRSTDESEIGLDFKKYPGFYKNLTTIRLGDTYASDTIVRAIGSGEFRKYGYRPTPDHRYVLELSLNVDDLISNVNLSSFSTISNTYTQNVPGIKSVFVFGKLALYNNDPVAGLQHPDHYLIPYTERSDRLQNINTTFTTRGSIYKTEPGTTESRKYIYVPSPETSAPSFSELGQVIEITYDMQNLRNQQKSAFLTYLAGVICCIIIVILVAFVVTRYITHPIDQIVADIEIISDGAYDHPISHTHGFEFGRLEASIGKMVHRLKDDIISIRQKSEDLDRELGQRVAAEELLRSANRKLNLLSSITRHDILNQISVITGALDLLSEESSSQYLIGIIQRSVTNIHKQISFTKLYELMGSHQPIWQRMSDMVIHAREGITLHGVKIEDNAGSLEIYADQMVNRAIFNLFENAVRHGGEVSCITLEFISLGKEGILVIADDGYGVPVGEKEKIFIRGYGSNTGLGLFLVREILLITGMTIKENGIAGSGARFEIHIPEGAWRTSDDGTP
ncbi:MAG TPA: HAMP domain-containing sensor histidine kinase, partial [Methanospirillum sp.]|uniref:HAMP domain-containing sensor histidine kinase n=1 Tax=Methanospirillum sp. TaxID=45200 RepID=UPI002BC9C124